MLTSQQRAARARVLRDRRIAAAERTLDRCVDTAERFPRGGKTNARYLRLAEAARTKIRTLEESTHTDSSRRRLQRVNRKSQIVNP